MPSLNSRIIGATNWVTESNGRHLLPFISDHGWSVHRGSPVHGGDWRDLSFWPWPGTGGKVILWQDLLMKYAQQSLPDNLKSSNSMSRKKSKRRMLRESGAWLSGSKLANLTSFSRRTLGWPTGFKIGPKRLFCVAVVSGLSLINIHEWILSPSPTLRLLWDTLTLVGFEPKPRRVKSPTL